MNENPLRRPTTGDVAVWFGALDEPRTEGQLRVRARPRAGLARARARAVATPHRLTLFVTSQRPFRLTPPEGRRAYDVAPDGRIVGVIVPAGGDESTGSQVLAVVLNWHEELKAKCRRLGADYAERFIRSQQSDLAGRKAFPTSLC